MAIPNIVDLPTDTRERILSRLKEAARLYSLNKPQDIGPVVPEQPQPVGLMSLNRADLQPLQTQGTAYGTAAEQLRRQRVGMAGQKMSEEDILGVVSKVAQLDKQAATDLYNRTLGSKYGKAEYNPKKGEMKYEGRVYRENKSGEWEEVFAAPEREKTSDKFSLAVRERAAVDGITPEEAYKRIAEEKRVAGEEKGLGPDALPLRESQVIASEALRDVEAPDDKAIEKAIYKAIETRFKSGGKPTMEKPVINAITRRAKKLWKSGSKSFIVDAFVDVVGVSNSAGPVPDGYAEVISPDGRQGYVRSRDIHAAIDEGYKVVRGQ